MSSLAMTEAVLPVDDFMQPSDIEAEKDFPVFHILLGNHDAADHVSFVQQFCIIALPK